jgi:hypothetical protein
MIQTNLVQVWSKTVRRFIFIIVCSLTTCLLAAQAKATVTAEVNDGVLEITGDHEHDEVYVQTYLGNIIVFQPATDTIVKSAEGITRISINLGGGGDDLQVYLFLDVDVDIDFGSYAVDGDGGVNTDDFEQLEIGGEIGGDVTVDSQGNARIVTATYLRIEGDFTICTGNSFDLIDLRRRSDFNTFFVGGDLNIDTGEGEDALLLHPTTFGFFDDVGSVYIDMGTGGNSFTGDLLELGLFNIGGDLMILGGEGIDDMRFQYNTIGGNVLLHAGNGKDDVLMTNNGLDAQGLIFLDGGNGMDTLDLNGAMLDPAEYANFETVIP